MNEKRKSWQQDPYRREAILRATLDCIERHGVVGTTYRKICEVSNIPLGSLTYYFPNMQGLVEAAFQSMAREVSSRFAATIRMAKTKEEACSAIEEIIFGKAVFGERTSQLSYELYSFSCRNPPIRKVMRDWTSDSRQSLEQYFSPLAAVALDALIEGIVLHRSVIPISREDARKMIDRLADL